MLASHSQRDSSAKDTRVVVKAPIARCRLTFAAAKPSVNRIAKASRRRSAGRGEWAAGVHRKGDFGVELVGTGPLKLGQRRGSGRQQEFAAWGAPACSLAWAATRQRTPRRYVSTISPAARS
jgi:hypothetical protein